MRKFHVQVVTVIFVAITPLAAASAKDVRGREAHQQQRIGRGLRSGQLTAGGAAHLEHREQNINVSRRADLAADGGHLTGREYRNLNRRENAVSNRIYDRKHNGVAQLGVVPYTNR